MLGIIGFADNDLIIGGSKEITRGNNLVTGYFCFKCGFYNYSRYI